MKPPAHPKRPFPGNNGAGCSGPRNGAEVPPGRERTASLRENPPSPSAIPLPTPARRTSLGRWLPAWSPAFVGRGRGRWCALALVGLGCWPAQPLQAAPAVSGFSPTRGIAGTQVTVNGSGFTNARRVLFNDAPADFRLVSANQLVAVVPFDAITGPIRVEDASSVGSSATAFMAAPRITNFTPARSGTNGTVSIEGFNFSDVTNVLFGATPARFSATTPKQIRTTVPQGATNTPAARITVESPAGRFVSSNDFTVIGPAPVVDGFWPIAGAPGAQITIEGVNLADLSLVEFGSVASTRVVQVTETQINADVPAGAVLGSAKITVTTTKGTALSTNDFLVTRAPVITNFTPAYGKAGYTLVTIEGINFTNLTGVGFNGRSITTQPPTPSTPHSFQVQVPSGATTGLISVTNNYGSGRSAANFVVGAPVIEEIQPLEGKVGDNVSLWGANLTNSTIRFNGVAASFTVTGQAPELLQVKVPSGATTGPISASNSVGIFVSSRDFTVYGGGPLLAAFNPAAGARHTQVILEGRNFFPPVTVRFNGVVDPYAYAASSSQITAYVPAGAQTGPVSVTTPNGSTTNSQIFYVPPQLTGFSPTAAPVGDSIALSGTNFIGTTEVTFNNVPAEFTVAASNRIDAIVPAGATAGPIRVVAPAGAFITTTTFKILPRITSFEPILGPAGTKVTVRGTSFLPVTQLRFNNTLASLNIISASEIQTTVPANASTGPIRLTTPDGAVASTSDFTVTTGSDLTLRHLTAPAFAEPGLEQTWTLEVTNRGPSIVTGVQLTDYLPPGVILLSATSSQGSCNTNPTNPITCSLGVLNARATATLTIVGLPTTEGYLLTNRAAVTMTEEEYNVGDNTSIAVSTFLHESSRTLNIPQLTGATQLVVSWPTSAAPWQLQWTPTLGATNTWTAATPAPVAVGGWYMVTNSIQSTNDRFYRLYLP